MIFANSSKAMAPENTEALLTCFFTGCAEHFGFLHDHGFNSVSGLSHYQKGRRILSPFCAPSNIAPPFEAATLFERDETAFEISYGGEHYTLNLHVCYAHVHRFLLRDVFQAARKPMASKLDTVRVPNIKSLENALENSAKTVRKNADFITDLNPKILERTLVIHDKLVEEKIRAQHQRDVEETERQAAKAYATLDYTRVVEMLTPYERYISAASAKKLDRARKTLLNI